MKSEDEDIEVTVGSGNVFEDLGFAKPDISLAKADLARQIEETIRKRKLTQQEAAEIMGIDQPKVSDIIRGKLSKYTLDRLIRFLIALGKDVDIVVREKPRGAAISGIHVRSESSKRPPRASK